MSVTPERYSCAAASVGRDEPVAGTATHVRTWLLLEHSGPWGNTALRDARLPEGLGAELRRRAKEHRAKILLVRRARAVKDPARLNVFAAYADPRSPRLEHGTVADLREVLDLDLGALRTGGSTGLPPSDEGLLCVCTNGRHDACCAEFGRPVAMALDDARPEETWEVSHIGGDRFAGNLVVLPEGLYYGRLDVGAGLAVADAHSERRLHLDHLRGRASYPMPVQAAEVHLLRHLGLDGIHDVALVGRRVDGEVTTATFAAPDGTRHAVQVRTTIDPDAAYRLTCKAHRPDPAPRHDLLAIQAAG